MLTALTQILRTKDTIARVDNDGALVVGADYRLQNGNTIEIVRVLAKSNNTVLLEREVDHTDAGVFVEGTFFVSATSTRSVTQNLSFIFTIEGSGAIQWDGKQLTYPKVTIEGFGAAIATGTVDIQLGRKDDAYGCCDGNNGLGILPPQGFVLTSLLYPLEDGERIGIDLARLVESNIDGEEANAGTDSMELTAYVTFYMHPYPLTEFLESLDIEGQVTPRIRPALLGYGNENMDIAGLVDPVCRVVVLVNNSREEIDVAGVVTPNLYTP